MTQFFTSYSSEFAKSYSFKANYANHSYMIYNFKGKLV